MSKQFRKTNRELFEYNSQEKQLKNTLVGQLLNGKMTEFKARHFSLIQSLEKRLAYMNKQYFLFKGEKMQMQPVYEKKTYITFLGMKFGSKRVKTDKQEPILMPGKTMADYEKEFAQLMNEEVILEF